MPYTVTDVTAAELKPGMIARRSGLVLCRNPFRPVAEVLSNAPYAGKTIRFADGSEARTTNDTGFEVSTAQTMPTALDLIACMMGAYATSATA